LGNNKTVKVQNLALALPFSDDSHPSYSLFARQRVIPAPIDRLILRMRNGEKCMADRNGEEKCRLKTVELGICHPRPQLQAQG
jgi:hypothetical protein